MPPTKRTRITAALPVARDAAVFLREQGKPGMAEAVETTIEWAERAEQSAARQASIDAGLDPNYSLHVDKEFRTHVRAAAEEKGKDLASVVAKGLEAFRDGTWMPPAPVRARRGSATEKVSLNVRIPKALFDEVDAMAKDPEQAGERGYALNARQVAIAALAKAFPMKKKATAK
ncbi:hypothetical protein [Streptomyces asiaticus]|uniref:hypothetical protein n=1 Tax=Streptomyces asiaticus TaxID=114695 RepID=UPI00380FB049